ncbi:hypothetical protein [Microbacterium sp. 179-I 3D4 NHS]|uniref:hypothetical protein n=1 Tax=Microbacterium sp. 179-I 3D4 NHS TaxID=3142381 RepID=UPI0039A2BDD4
MTSLHTLPTPVPAPARSHEHAWTVESRHPTADGILLYVRCTGCAVRRVDLTPHPHLPPTALSRVLGTSTVRP